MDTNDLYYEIFNVFAKGKKSFGTKELGQVMQSYGMKPSELELQDMISQLDINASGEIEFREFKEFMTQKIKRHEAEEELREAFSLFDVDGNGFIPTRDFRQAMNILGEHFSYKEIDEMLKDFENDEEINIDEMITMLTSNSKK